MNIFELQKPGTKIANIEITNAWEVEWLFKSLELHFFEANLALNLYVLAKSEGKNMPCSKQWKKDLLRCYEIGEKFKSQHFDGNCKNSFNSIKRYAKIELKKEKWDSGRYPQQYISVLPTIYARGFIYALESFSKLLSIMSSFPMIPLAIPELYKRFLNSFPTLSSVVSEYKNTTSDLMDNKLNYLFVNQLDNDRFWCVLINGEYAEIDVSNRTMETLQSILNDLFLAFDWEGPKVHLPF